MTTIKPGDLFKFEVLKITGWGNNEKGERYVPRYVVEFWPGWESEVRTEHDNTKNLLVGATCSYLYEDIEVLEVKEKIGTVLEVYEDKNYATYKWMNPLGCGMKDAQETGTFKLDSEHFKKV
jgi:hypothetical protein